MANPSSPNAGIMDRSPPDTAQSLGSVPPERSPFHIISNYPAANFRSQLVEDIVSKFTKDYDIPTRAWHIYMARKNDRIWHNPPAPEGYGQVATSVSEAAFKCGFRVPVLPLIKKLFAEMGIALGQRTRTGSFI
ncbi:hypothetical protein POM88_016371 [Heracleum sosnowskyi]|uniref:Uncharacterized protein n=1 Tax=Heracleum sosnowskyi TaxID=360622 RepID=A0AAD8IN68_9APIA|nr:hypothetical protein POM88_016371 [Heracleum sosnowskyi]